VSSVSRISREKAAISPRKALNPTGRQAKSSRFNPLEENPSPAIA
jgi:hypothetical protein